MIKCLVATRTASTNPQLSSDEAHLFAQLTDHAAGLARQLKIATQHAVQLASPAVTWQCVAQQNSTSDCRF